MLGNWSALADALAGEWSPRPEQLPPSDDQWAVWLYLAGRGAGKTRAGAEAVRADVESGRCGRVGLIAPTAADARDVMLLGPSGILTISPDATRPTFAPSLRRVSWESGAVAFLYSAEEADRLRGPAHDLLWGDEVAAWGPGAQHVLDMAMFGLRIGKRPRAILTTTPRPIKLLRDLLKRDGQDVRVTRGSTYSNREHLPRSFLDQMEKQYAGTRLGRQELEAVLLEDTPGALWSRDLIEATRLPSHVVPDCRRIVVAIDPAVSTGADSNLTGIIVAGVDYADRGFVLEDLSGRFSPTEWATKAIAAYRRHQADRIVAEANQGGQMVEATLRAIDPSVSYRAVHASRGKLTRAEPVSALYEQHRIHHVGALSELEDEMCGFAPNMPGGMSGGSPDRVDALVWAFTDLMIVPQRPTFVFA
jgi:phage terminase large subunit-like protein